MRFIEGFLSPAEADRWLQRLYRADWIKWQRETFSIYGKEVQAPRSLAWFGDRGMNYRYTGLDHFTQGWPEELCRLKEQVEQAAGQRFNFLLLNRYENGGEHMGWHRDDEKGCSSNIASLSIGAPRRFAIDCDELPNIGGKRQENYELGEGALLIFDGRQRHCLRPTKKSCGTRINLTFRQITA